MKRLLLCAALIASSALARDNAQWAQSPPEVRDWFQAQIVPDGPNKGQSCCSSADGVHAEEDRREGHYWTKFQACGWFTAEGRHECRDVDWMMVPDSAVLRNYNAPSRDIQLPIVWWYNDGKNWVIRCYAPEPDA